MNVSRIVTEVLKELLKGKPNATVLDVGAGTGYMHSWVSQAGFNYFAIDTDDSVRLKLEEKGIPVLNSYDDIERLGIKVDALLFGNMDLTDAVFEPALLGKGFEGVKFIEWDVTNDSNVSMEFGEWVSPLKEVKLVTFTS